MKIKREPVDSQTIAVTVMILRTSFFHYYYYYYYYDGHYCYVLRNMRIPILQLPLFTTLYIFSRKNRYPPTYNTPSQRDSSQWSQKRPIHSIVKQYLSLPYLAFRAARSIFIRVSDCIYKVA